MRALLLAVVVSAATLAGCLGSVEETIDGPDHGFLVPGPGIRLYTAAGLDQGSLLLDTGAFGEAWSKLTGFNGAEPTMAIWPSGTLFASGGSGGIRSTDGGESWEEVIRIGLPSSAPATPVNSVYRSWDPMVWYDKWTERVYFDPMFPPLACSQLSWSTDDGDSWTTNPAVCHPPPMDHQKLFSGPPGPDAPPIAGVAHPTVLYQCYNEIVATNCGISYDGGLTWALTTNAANVAEDGCGGTNGHGTVSDLGIAVLPIGASCDELTLAVSTDSGLTWDLREVSGGRGAYGFDFDVVFDEDETLYVLWEGDDYRMNFARSADYGETWEGPFDVTPPDVKSVFFQTMNVGADGRIAMAFLGEKTHGGNPNEAATETHWYLFIVTSEDRDAEVLELVSYQVDAEDDPMHVGQICTGGIGCSTGRDLLEFIDSAIAPDGTFHVIYTDSCADTCLEDANLTEESKDGRHLKLARLGGWSMLDPAIMTAVESAGQR